jgi:hypothetical protein
MTEKNSVKLTAQRPFSSTWRGRAGTSTEYRTESRSFGRRVIVHVWADSPDVADVRAIRGDGRTSTFQEYERRTVPVAEAEAVAQEMADRHFGRKR